MLAVRTAKRHEHRRVLLIAGDDPRFLARVLNLTRDGRLFVGDAGLLGALACVDGGDHVLVVPFDKTL